MSLSNIDPTEKKVVSIAIIFSIGHLLLIAYAATFLHISVPTCQPNEKLFKEPSLNKVGHLRYEVHYLARMWEFLPQKLVLPVDSTVEFFLASTDVNHGFHIDGTLVNLMAVSGVINRASQVFSKKGKYQIICHEYCGYGHQNMTASIEVSDSVTEASIDGASTDKTSLQAATELKLSPAALAGRNHYQTKGCTGCHNVSGAPGGVGPTFKGLYGRAEEMSDGLKLIVDDAYITESIQYPAKKIVKGYANVMPNLPISDSEIIEIIEYIKTIK